MELSNTWYLFQIW